MGMDDESIMKEEYRLSAVEGNGEPGNTKVAETNDSIMSKGQSIQEK